MNVKDSYFFVLKGKDMVQNIVAQTVELFTRNTKIKGPFPREIKN